MMRALLLCVCVLLCVGCSADREMIQYEGQVYDLESLRDIMPPPLPEPIYMDND